ncbi:MAG: HD domain-containing protein [Lachnospiraceae bacterium]|nr:HD domain-containing protein [Lachnospiraceae bacterium]
MFNLLYTALFVLSILMLVVLVSCFRDRISVFYVLLYVSVAVTNFGYMQLCASQDLNAAVYANQTVYLGASFCPFFLLMCMADLCKVKVPRIVQSGFILLGCVIFFFISSIGVFPWYYRSVSFVRENGVSNLMKEYGPLHTLYPLYLIVVVILALTFIILSFRKKKDVSYVTSALLLVCMIITVAVYIVEKSLHLQVTILPIAYVISQAGVLFLLRRISLYDISAITADSMVESVSFGFVICDFKEKFLGGDVAAKLWFPEINELKLDAPIKSETTDFLQQLGKWVRDEDDREIVYFERDGYIIEAKHAIITEKKHHPIHCVYLRDDTKQQAYTKLVEQYNENLERDVNAKTAKISRMQDDIIISMASIVENRDSNTGGHIARTSDVVKIFVQHLQRRNICPELTPEVAQCIIKAAPLHDFGKIAIPDVILNKPGKFEPEEYKEMKKHSAKGAVIVERILQNTEDVTFQQIAVNIAHYHHEKWDGNGYPDRISGTDIPFEARVMALADVFDALVSKRVYKDSYGYDKAFSIIEESCGSHFDPLLCKEFLQCRPALEKLYDSYED